MKAVRNLLFAFAAVAVSSSTVLAKGFDEGIEYQLVKPPVPSQTGAKLEVVELFWYGCPHCFQFEPHLHAWLEKKPENVRFVRVPAIFNQPSWLLHARAYYTAETLGVLDKIHQPLFNALHVQKRKLLTEKSLQNFFAKHGVNAKEFSDTFHSFAVDNKVRRAVDLTRRYGIDGVPTIVVNGKYRTSARRAGTNQKMLQVLDYLLEKEARAK